LIQPLYDPNSGAIDHVEAESYRRFDIADRLRKDPKRFVPLFRDRVHLVVGGADTYYLNEAVELLKADLDKLDPPKPDDASHTGYIKIVPGTDHGTVMGSPEYRAWPQQMLDYLRRAAHAVPTTK
jgi:hypothetical protein